MASRVAAAALVATLAFWAYTQTLLPGVDLGDTGGFQASVLWPDVSARQAYPLYYALARPFVGSLSPANPARGLNLFSALFGALAAGLLTVLTASLTASLAAGIAAGLLLAFSYTFWSQAIIAEVYTLHLTLVLLSCLALLAYQRQPSRPRLALFFAVYAVGFGNHLSMILLFAPFTLFLLQVTPRPRTLFRPPVVLMALAIAAAGALQYWPDLMATWHAPDVSAAWTDRLAAFWFDATKADWRESMVLDIRNMSIADRAGMWWFDARQQFGWIGWPLAAAGVIRLWSVSPPWAAMLLLAWTINTGFAFTYNVGDTHVFYLPSHLFAALSIGVACMPVGHRVVGRGDRRDGRAATTGPTPDADWPSMSRASLMGCVVAIAVIGYAGWRGWDTWPALDRHGDRRADRMIAGLTLGIDHRNAVLITDLNWQLENTLLYASRYQRRDLAWIRLKDVLLHFPFVVRDNEAISRDVVLDATAGREVLAQYGDLFPLTPDSAPGSQDLVEAAAQLPSGTRYVLCVLTPPRDEQIAPERLAALVATLTGTTLDLGRGGAFQLVAGVTGAAPSLTRSEERPFRADFRLLGDPFTVRMESWLPSDTFRRAGFGHVIRGREHVLTLERGVSLVWFDRAARPSAPHYEASLYAPLRRYRISSVAPALARKTQ